jgi:hypothetical protein
MVIFSRVMNIIAPIYVFIILGYLYDKLPVDSDMVGLAGLCLLFIILNMNWHRKTYSQEKIQHLERMSDIREETNELERQTIVRQRLIEQAKNQLAIYQEMN